MASASVWTFLASSLFLSTGVQVVSVEGGLEQRLFESFVSNYSKSYTRDPDTWNLKFQVFQQSLARQQKLNEYEREHGGTAVYGVNQFSDLTPEEFRAMYLSPVRKLSPSRFNNYQEERESFTVDHFDWREKQVIGEIRNQQRCGSCWAFAVVETIESAYAIEQGQKLNFTLSSQQLISCDQSTVLNLDGCRGGQLDHAFQSLRNKGLVVVGESVYPFESADGNDHTCRTNLPDRGLKLTNFTFVNSASLNEMMAMMLVSPLTTSINAVGWQDYAGGIVQHHCTDTFVDHAVQVVGYDLTSDVPYWIVRNTWGDSWGEKGYVRVLHGANMCGIRDEVACVNEVKGVNV